MTLITGNTYPVRLQIIALGGHWDKSKRGWLVPDHAAGAARALVARAATGYREPLGVMPVALPAVRELVGSGVAL